MKKIAFFCRSRLTQLYGELNRYLCSEFSCVYIAYSNEDYKALKNKYQIDVDFNFKNYLYQNFENAKNIEIEEIDRFIIENSKNRFNVNSVIQSDRALCNLKQEEAYNLIKAYYMFWMSFFSAHKDLDFFFHETTSLALNFIASLFCNQNSVIYTDMVGVPNVNPSFMFISSSDGQALDFDIDKLAEESIVNKFENYISQRYTSISNLSINTSLMQSLKVVIKNRMNRFYNHLSKRIDRVLDCVEWFMLHDPRYMNKIKNIFMYKIIKWDEPNVSENYYYYSMNLEPEAVIQYLADGYYSSQVKLIENIAAQLPPNSYLYVKDHVVEYGYRNYKDYKYLQSLHNVKVINPRVRGSELIKNCNSVISICGTAIMEAHFFNKCSFMFGNFYYEKSKNVYKIRNIKDFRDAVYSFPVFDVAEGKKFISSFLASLHLGSPDYFSGGITESANDAEFSDNIIKISNAIVKYVVSNCNKGSIIDFT